MIPISLEEYLSFPCGWLDPPYNISEWNPPLHHSCPSQEDSPSSSSHRDNSQSQPTHHNWDHLSYSAADTSTHNGLAIDSTSLPMSSFTPAALMGGPLADSHLSFIDPSHWTAFSSLPNTGSASYSTSTMGLVPNVPSLSMSISSDSPSNYPMSRSLTENLPDISQSQTSDQGRSPESGSSSSSPKNHMSPSSETSSTSKLSNPKSASRSTESTARVEKRRQNTLAARRYRQKRVDQMSSLESTLKETQTERDDLKVRVARLEGEVETLRQLLKSR